MKAYHDDIDIKENILVVLATHRKADELIKGEYWANNKGCAVGCTVKGKDHSLYESMFGIPQILAYLEDTIFEGLPNELSQRWPERFMFAITPGQDLSLIGWKFLYWLLTDKDVNPGINDPLVCDSVRLCAEVVLAASEDRPIDVNAAKNAWSAAKSAGNAAKRARSEAYTTMSDKLITLIEEA